MMLMHPFFSSRAAATLPSSACECATTDLLHPVLAHIPVSYGLQCRAHDLGVLHQCKIITSQAETFANGAAYLSNAPYCGQSWCYVKDGPACLAAGGVAHKSFSGEEDLYYSYETCGAIDFYTPNNRDCQCVNLLGSNDYGVYRWPDGEFEQGDPTVLLADDPRKDYPRFYLNPSNGIPYAYLGARSANTFPENGIARSSIFTKADLTNGNMVDLEFNYYGKTPKGARSYCIVPTRCPTAWQSPFVMRGDPQYPYDVGLPFTSLDSHPDGREHNIGRTFPRERFNASLPYPRLLPRDLRRLGSASDEVSHWRLANDARDAWPTLAGFLLLHGTHAHVVEHAFSLDACRYECDLAAACAHVVYYDVRPLLRRGDALRFSGLEVVHERTNRTLPRFANEFDRRTGAAVVPADISEEAWETVVVDGAHLYNLPAGRCVLLGISPLEDVGGGTRSVAGDDWAAAAANVTRLSKGMLAHFETPPRTVRTTVNELVRSAYDTPVFGDLLRNVFSDYEKSVDLRPQTTALALPAFLNSFLQEDKLTSWANYVVDPLALVSVRLVMVMERNFNFHARLFIPNVIAAYTPTARVCENVAINVDNDLLAADRISDCPPEHAARARHTSFFSNPLEHYAQLHGEAVHGSRDNIMRYYVGSCKERERQQVVYNGTHVFVAFGYTSDDTWEDNVDLWDDDGQLCSHPYLTGRVHCGHLGVALRRLARLTDDTLDDARGDPCPVFMEGRRCTSPPTWVFSGLSQGGTTLILFMELLRTYLRTFHGISTASMDLRIYAFQPSAAFDDAFVSSYETHFGTRTKMYLDRSDPFVLNTQLLARTVDTDAVVTSSTGGCGNDAPKKLSECVHICDPSKSDRVLSCAYLLLSAFNPEEHYNTPLKLLRYDETIPSEYRTRSDTFNLDLLGFVAASLDSFTRANRAHSFCLEALTERDAMPHVCAKEINADPWQPNSVTALATVLRGETYRWCIAHRIRLKARIAALDLSEGALAVFDENVCCATAGRDEETADTVFVQHEVLERDRFPGVTRTTPRVSDV